MTPLSTGPLHGVRVIELTKIWAGPYAGKLLAFLGAEVIRVESLDSLDASRRFGVKDINAAPGFQAVNPGKCSIQLNMKSDEGQRLLADLVKKSDIVIENLRPGAAKRLGFGYEQLRELKRDIIAVAMSMHGQEGPLSYQTGYAPSFSALGGVCHLVGLKDGAPKLLNVRYGDSSYGSAAAFAALVALYHRRRTGEGQYVDVSAVETLASVVGDAFMEYFLTGKVPTRNANRHSEMAPHGVYPCGDEDWISIAVRTQDEWHALCAAMGNPALAADPRFVDRAARQQHAAELDVLLEAWTKPQDAQELGERLRARGVAAFKSLNSIDLVSSDHLWRRGFFQHVSDPARGEMSIAGAPWRLSLTPAKITRSAPRLGEHNDYVFGELLGLSEAERERLVAEKIVY
ncbi:MAG TPA: CoA transferase [Povalibacter sp.]|uniref:CaiB/BaiF CoA transferase family protein n=1 Tax=Povalibacter sp. TaxID=1962978 RepID=UPI002C58F17E|nr:CoA transferase [Povalibacter sp.]HMN43670.1 CoA transferase [Povalibacter sp.]